MIKFEIWETPVDQKTLWDNYFFNKNLTQACNFIIYNLHYDDIASIADRKWL